jgi:hypothetical protein
MLKNEYKLRLEYIKSRHSGLHIWKSIRYYVLLYDARTQIEELAPAYETRLFRARTDCFPPNI